MQRLAFVWIPLVATMRSTATAHAQPVPPVPVALPSQPPREKTDQEQRRRQVESEAADASCVALHWWDHGVVCGASSRREEYVGGLLMGSVLGAVAGAPTGLLFREQCNRGVGSAAGRGALAGMAITTAAVTLLPRASRAELERRERAERATVARSTGRRVWRAARPVLTYLGTAAAGGAIIGAVDTGATNCGLDASAGALKGAGVYTAGAGSLALMSGLITLIRR